MNSMAFLILRIFFLYLMDPCPNPSLGIAVPSRGGGFKVQDRDLWSLLFFRALKSRCKHLISSHKKTRAKHGSWTLAERGGFEPPVPGKGTAV